MSQETVELGKRAIEAFARRELDAYDELYAPDFQWFPAGPLALQGEGYSGYRGREGIETYFSDSRAMWEEIRTVGEEEFRDLGDRVLMLGRIEVSRTSSGATIDAPFGVIFDLRDGKIWRMRAYLDRGEALRAAGLAE